MTTRGGILNFRSLVDRGAAYLAGTSRSVRRGRGRRAPLPTVIFTPGRSLLTARDMAELPEIGWIPAPRFHEDKLRGDDRKTVHHEAEKETESLPQDKPRTTLLSSSLRSTRG